MTKQEFIEAVKNETTDELDFQPFSKIEELFIKKEYLADYYRLKREYDYNNGKALKGMVWRDMLHPILLKLVSLNRKYIDKQTLTILNDARQNNKKKKLTERVKSFVKGEKKKTVIYAITHIDKYDFQLVSEAIKDHQYPFAGDPETMYRSFDGAVLGLNGVVYCDTESKTDRKVAKNTSIDLLKKGKNLLIYPEGVWNVTSNLLMLPLFGGIIEMAKETGCDIIPVAIERYDKNYVVNIGTEFNVNDKLAAGLNEEEIKTDLRDEMATLKWNIMESLPKSESAEEVYFNTKRSELGTYREEEKKFQEERLNEWTNPETKLPYYTVPVVKSRTFKDKDKNTGYRVDLPEDAFAYMSKAKLHKNNILMFPKDRSLPAGAQDSLNQVLQTQMDDLLEEFDQEKKKVA